jgi:aspartokinase
VYGFDIRKDISLIELSIPTEHAAYLGEQIQVLDGDNRDFIMVLAQYVDRNVFRLSIAMDQDKAASFVQVIEDTSKKEYRLSIRLQQPVDAIFFHGPHFQDRYGITEAALRTLDHDRITLYSTGCTGTSVYLIVGSGQADLAKKMLARSFIVPGRDGNILKS